MRQKSLEDIESFRGPKLIACEGEKHETLFLPLLQVIEMLVDETNVQLVLRELQATERF